MGRQIYERINDYDCKKFKVIVKAQMVMQKKLMYKLTSDMLEYFQEE